MCSNYCILCHIFVIFKSKYKLIPMIDCLQSSASISNSFVLITAQGGRGSPSMCRICHTNIHILYIYTTAISLKDNDHIKTYNEIPTPPYPLSHIKSLKKVPTQTNTCNKGYLRASRSLLYT